jgi:hypothetical protein
VWFRDLVQEEEQLMEEKKKKKDDKKKKEAAQKKVVYDKLYVKQFKHRQRKLLLFDFFKSLDSMF